MVLLETPSQIKIIEHQMIDKYSLDEETLIQEAARKCYKRIRERVLNKKVLFLIGPGNNGSDGLEIARLLYEENKDIKLYFLKENGNKINLKLRKKYSYIETTNTLEESSVIIDALFGYSYREREDDKLKELIDEINAYKSYVISIDLPSLLRIKADETITFLCYKLPFYLPKNRDLIGKLYLENPGFPLLDLKKYKSFLIEDGDYKNEDISISSYKNKRGHLAVLGGSEKYKGAPILSCLASLHASAGLVSLISSDKVIEEALKTWPSIISVREGDFIEENYDAFILGPGWDKGNEELLDKVIKTNKPFLIDADALKLLKGKKLGYNGVITPHIGEYKMLCNLLDIDNGLDSSDKLKEALIKLSDKLETSVILKSSTLWFIDKDKKLYVYDGVNPSIGVAGSGDILSGIIGTFLMHQDIKTACINGIIVHQEAGRRAHEKYGYYPSEEIINEIRI